MLRRQEADEATSGDLGGQGLDAAEEGEVRFDHSAVKMGSIPP